MLQPLQLELLEDRTVPSAAYVPTPDAHYTFAPGDFGGSFAHAMGGDYHWTNRVAFNAALSIYPQLDGVNYGKDLIPLNDIPGGRPNDNPGDHWQYERETLSSLASSLESGANDGPVENGFPEIPSSSLRETAGSASQDRSPMASEVSGQLSSLSAVASIDSLSSLSFNALADGTAETIPSGTFADAVFLDGWQGGLPSPRADLVPASDKDLTIIAAYLVGSPTDQSAAAIRGKETPATGVETGPTDFIVGQQPQRLAPSPSRTANGQERPAPQPLACDCSPAAPEHISPAPPVDANTPDMPTDGQDGSPAVQNDGNDVPEAAPESADLPETSTDAASS